MSDTMMTDSAIGTKTIALENIKKDTFMIWEMSTNAGNKISVKLSDDENIYVDNSTQGVGHKVLSEGYKKVASDNLKLEIDVKSPDGGPVSSLQFFVLPYSVPRADGTIAGQGYNIMLEDQRDGDFNDLIIFIYSCKSER